MAGRKSAKKKRDLFDKGTSEWDGADREQLAFKLIINSLYGCMGYPGFILYNIFIAEAITNQGRQIITSAINAIENFLADAMWLENPTEIYHVIRTNHEEFMNKVGRLSDTAREMFRPNISFDELPELVTKRYISKCTFTMSSAFRNSIFRIFKGMSTDELIYMYYKNNSMEFMNLPVIKTKLKKLIQDNGLLAFCTPESYKDDGCRELIQDVIELFEFFVLYDHPIYDRVRKAMYYDKYSSLYTDTDSVFISLDKVIRFIRDKVFDTVEESGQSPSDLRFTSANITLTILNNIIDHAMKTLCYSANIPKEQAKALAMKNEFFFPRIVFPNIKKRYIALGLLQEGKLLGGGKGLAEIKGFDFIKATTKPFVKDYYTKICLEDILYPEKIDPIKVFNKIMALKTLMENTIDKGNMEFFKQANVKHPMHYKNPYSTQGVIAITLWNTLCPEHLLEFPTDVNIAPIKELTYPKPPKPKDGAPINRSITKSPLEYKNINWFAEKHPEAFSRLQKAIYLNDNVLIRHATLTSIAIPKNLDYELPAYVKDLIDTTSIINNTLNLFLPVMKCIGLSSYQVNSNSELISNMVAI
jgi:hypothetical protein